LTSCAERLRNAGKQDRTTTHIQAPHAIEAINLGLLGDSIGPAIRLLRNLLSSRIVAAFEPFGLRSGTFSTMALIAANPGRLVAAGGQATHPAHAPGVDALTAVEPR
jgi:hypothetical protein